MAEAVCLSSSWSGLTMVFPSNSYIFSFSFTIFSMCVCPRFPKIVRNLPDTCYTINLFYFPAVNGFLPVETTEENMLCFPSDSGRKVFIGQTGCAIVLCKQLWGMRDEVYTSCLTISWALEPIPKMGNGAESCRVFCLANDLPQPRNNTYNTIY